MCVWSHIHVGILPTSNSNPLFWKVWVQPPAWSCCSRTKTFFPALDKSAAAVKPPTPLPITTASRAGGTRSTRKPAKRHRIDSLKISLLEGFDVSQHRHLLKALRGGLQSERSEGPRSDGGNHRLQRQSQETIVYHIRICIPCLHLEFNHTALIVDDRNDIRKSKWL